LQPHLLQPCAIGVMRTDVCSPFKMYYSERQHWNYFWGIQKARKSPWTSFCRNHLEGTFAAEKDFRRSSTRRREGNSEKHAP
jgi:hypothetical protein